MEPEPEFRLVLRDGERVLQRRWKTTHYPPIDFNSGPKYGFRIGPEHSWVLHEWQDEPIFDEPTGEPIDLAPR